MDFSKAKLVAISRNDEAVPYCEKSLAILSCDAQDLCGDLVTRPIIATVFIRQVLSPC